MLQRNCTSTLLGVDRDKNIAGIAGGKMKIEHITIHNFRGIVHEEFSLDDYTLLVGSNNSGKSTVIDAIRAFYEKDKYQYQDAFDFPKRGAEGSESWIEITFLLTDFEFESLAENYKRSPNKLKVKKYFRTSEKLADGKSAKGVIVGMTSTGAYSNEPFYGAKNVQNGKLGNIIYIPAVSRVDDITKMSGPSALRDLISSIMSGVVEGSEIYSNLEQSVESFSGNIKTAQTQDERSITGLERELNDSLSTWNTTFSIHFQTPSTADIIKSMIKWDLIENSLGKPQDIDKFGSGFQRHFIYSIIKLANDYMPKAPKGKTKDFSPRMNLLLFEEPEAFLHPPQQQHLCKDLMTLSGTEDWQVILTTHSSHFVSRSVKIITSIVHLVKKDYISKIYQINQCDWNKIVDCNKMINDIAQKYPKSAKRLSEGDNRSDVEAIKYFLILNAERADAFFSINTILVEGTSEVGLINKLIDDGIIRNASGICVFDCLGKYNVHRFMNLFEKLGIFHSVLIDDDSNKTGDEAALQTEVNGLIETSRNMFTLAIEKIGGNLEYFLGLNSNVPSSKKPQEILLAYERGEISQDRICAFADIVQKCISGYRS